MINDSFIVEIQQLLHEALQRDGRPAAIVSRAATGNSDALRTIFNGRMPSAARLKALCDNLNIPFEIGKKEKVNFSLLRLSIEAVEEGLEMTDREMTPEDKAEMIVAVYDLLDDDVPVETIRKKYFTAA